jgi:hypothetical protein
MHAVLYVCLPRSLARSSMQARKKVCEYLTQEGFDTQLRFSGRCDYFKVGGRWSGHLSLLRLQWEQPRQMARFWKRYETISTDEEAQALFREMFPEYRGKIPVGRNPHGHLNGFPDDAQIMDEPLFQQLKAGFNEEVTMEKQPNVIFTDNPDDDFEWPRTAEEAARFWVVVIDYHF